MSTTLVPNSPTARLGLPRSTSGRAALANSQLKSTAQLAATVDYGSTGWNLLYGAMHNGLGIDPAHFQLIYPFTQWNWPTPNVGYTTSAEYDFLATIPEWSAIGNYISSGTTFDGAYQEFLNTIMPYTSNPGLQQQIQAAYNNLTQATNTYQTDYAQAMAAYQADPSVVNNTPNFTAWLATAGGFAYNSKLEADETNVSTMQNVYSSYVNNAQTPNLSNAIATYNNPNYYTKLQDPQLSSFPPVPLWSINTTMQNWVNAVQGSGGTPGLISFSNSDQQYNYQGTWAQGATSISEWFWSVNVNGSWQRISQFESDQSLSCTIKFAAWDTIPIQPGPWYSGVSAFKNGPFKPGFSALPSAGNTNIFGNAGIVPLLKTGMLVGYQPSISISVSTSTYTSFLSQWNAATSIQVGPFQFGGSAGGISNNWTKTTSGLTFGGTSTSTVPLIFGITVNTLP